jgi:hypothetical protein
MKMLYAMAGLTTAANIVLAAVGGRQPAPEPVPAAAEPAGTGSAAAPLHVRAPDQRPPAPALRGDLGCEQELARSQDRVRSYRQIVSRARLISEQFEASSVNGARLAEVRQNLEQILGRPLGASRVECRGQRGQVCVLEGFDEKDRAAFADLSHNPWARTNLQSLEIGGPTSIHLELREPGSRDGGDVIRSFVQRWKAGDGLRVCEQRHPGEHGAIAVSISVTSDDEGEPPQRLQVEYTEGRLLGAFEACLLERVLEESASFVVPPRTAEARWGNVKLGNPRVSAGVSRQ